MKKAIIIAVLIAALSICLFSCEGPTTVHSTGLYEAYHLVDANVVVGNELVALKIDHVQELEQDEYGRRLFKYSTLSTFTGGRTDIYIISQETGEDILAYYQDICYLARLRKDGELNDEEIGKLKELNDWNKALDPSKMTFASNQPAGNLLSESEFETALRDHLGLEQEISIIRNNMETYGDSRQLYAVRTLDKNESGEILFDGYYFVVVDLNLDGYIDVCEEFDIKGDYQSAVHEFRDKYLAG